MMHNIEMENIDLEQFSEKDRLDAILKMNRLFKIEEDSLEETYKKSMSEQIKRKEQIKKRKLNKLNRKNGRRK